MQLRTQRSVGELALAVRVLHAALAWDSFVDRSGKLTVMACHYSLSPHALLILSAFLC
jgi:hypothetical protein